MLIKELIEIPELTGDRKRRLYTYLPVNFDENKRYPVLYMFDGHNVFYDEDATYGKSWGMKRYLDLTELDLMVVAVECNHEGTGRLDEYSPFPARPHGEFDVAVKGLGKIYMDWMVESLKPMIDDRYPTLSDREHTYIAGSSMGGLMTIYALAKYNHIFSRGASLSPSLWLGTRKVMQFINESDIDPNTWLYMDYGSEELDRHDIRRMMSIFKKVYGAFMDRGAFAMARIVPWGNHSEASWERQIPIFMRSLGIQTDDMYRQNYTEHWDDQDK